MHANDAFERIMLATVTAAALSAYAAPPPSGRWAFQGGGDYVGVALDRDGKCRGIDYMAEHGLQFLCTYSSVSDTITITEMWDQSNEHIKPSPPLQMKYVRDSDVILLMWGKGRRLTRVERLPFDE